MSMNRSTLHICFTLLLLAAAVPISIVQTTLAAKGDVTVESADPPSGEQDTVDLDVTITGKNFTNGAKARFWVTGSESNPGGITVISTTFVNPRTLVSRISIAAEASAGGFDIEVYSNGRRGKGIDLFKVVEKASGPQPPAPASDFEVVETTYDSATLTWSATGDDGMEGLAYMYDIRYLPNEAVTLNNWSSALRAILEPPPQAPGTPETFVLVDLRPETQYSIGILVVDTQGNCSDLVVAQTTTSTAPLGQWLVETVATSDNASGYGYGYGKDLVLDQGSPVISYGGEAAGNELRLARWQGSGWTYELIDPNFTHDNLDLEISPTGALAIAYPNFEPERWYYAEENGPSWDIQVFDSTRRSVPGNAQIELGFDDIGNPVIAYRKVSKRATDLSLARFNDTAWQLEIVESGVSASALGLATDLWGNPAVVYYDPVEGNPISSGVAKLGINDGTSWTIGPLEPVAYNGGAEIARNPVTGDFVVVVSSNENDMRTIRYFWRETPDGPWIRETVNPDDPSTPDGPRGITLAIDSSGTPFIAYRLSESLDDAEACAPYLNCGTNWVKIASRTGDETNPWVIETIREHAFVYGGSALNGASIVETTAIGGALTVRLFEENGVTTAYLVFGEGEKLQFAQKQLAP